MPGLNGVDLVRRLRASRQQTPVLRLTARDAAVDVVRGLDAGADDYAIAALGQSTDRTRARGLLEQAAKDTPEDVEVLVSLAEIYRNDGRGDAAQSLYARVLALDAGQLMALVGMGGVAMEHGQYA